ncbi:MAG: hypothetical protein WA919_17515 [Coleofasciculaceae cyanobacterium]
MFLFCRFQIIRSLVCLFSQRPWQKTYQVNSYASVLENINAVETAKIVQKDGCYLGINLPKSVVKEIRDFVDSTESAANGNTKNRFYLADKKEAEARFNQEIVVAEYFNPGRLCPTIKKLESDPKLLEVAATYLKSQPVCVGSRLWYSFPGSNNLKGRINFAQELFHYDPVDFGAINFFFYLTDVNLTSGPHVCACGTHNQKKLKHQLTLLIGRSDREILDSYDRDRIITICKEAGFGFAEDPFCFHKGTPPLKEGRLMLQVKFRLKDYQIWKR